MLNSCIFGLFFFFFNDTATTEIYTLSLHDALPILPVKEPTAFFDTVVDAALYLGKTADPGSRRVIVVISEGEERSEEHTSELQSPCNLVCRLLLEKKKKTTSVLSSVSIYICGLILI